MAPRTNLFRRIFCLNSGFKRVPLYKKYYGKVLDFSDTVLGSCYLTNYLPLKNCFSVFSPYMTAVSYNLLQGT